MKYSGFPEASRILFQPPNLRNHLKPSWIHLKSSKTLLKPPGIIWKPHKTTWNHLKTSWNHLKYSEKSWSHLKSSENLLKPPEIIWKPPETTWKPQVYPLERGLVAEGGRLKHLGSDSQCGLLITTVLVGRRARLGFVCLCLCLFGFCIFVYWFVCYFR